MSRWTSRKLWMAIAGAFIGVLVATGVMRPETQEPLLATVNTIVGGVMALLSVLGFIVAEAGVDKQRATGPSPLAREVAELQRKRELIRVAELEMRVRKLQEETKKLLEVQG